MSIVNSRHPGFILEFPGDSVGISLLSMQLAVGFVHMSSGYKIILIFLVHRKLVPI